MGIHHFTLTVVPRAYFECDLPVALSESERRRGDDCASGWWASHPPSEQFLSALRTLLPIDKSWGETEEYVSTDDWSCSDIRIWKEGGKVWLITFRISPVTDRWPVMQRFLTVVRDQHFVLIEERSGAVFEPDEQIVRERLASSRAMQFVRDPETTIVQAAKEVKE